MQKVTTFLTFKEKGEEAVNLYVSLIKNSRINSISHYQSDGLLPKGALQNASFHLDGVEFFAMDGGPYFSFAQGMSLFVHCDTQDEIDRLWEKLTEGGEEQPCGWLRDRYGVSWQIIPPILGAYLTDQDPEKARRVLEAMLQMKKIDIQALQDAYEG